MRRPLLLSIAACATLLALPAAAEPPPARDAARLRAEAGLKLFGADRFEEALEAFREAEALFHAPTLLLYQARCQRKLGRLLLARDLYARVLAEPPPEDAPRPFVEAHSDATAELPRLRAAIPVIDVRVTGREAGSAVVTIDGARSPDRRTEVDPGPHTVVVTVEGARTVRLVQLAEGVTEAIEIVLVPPASAPPSFGPGPAVAPSPARSGSLVPAAVAFGVGGLGLVAGTVAGIVSLSRVTAVRSQCAGDRCPLALQDDARAAAALGNVSTGSFVVAGVGVAAGVVLVVVRGRF